MRRWIVGPYDGARFFPRWSYRLAICAWCRLLWEEWRNTEKQLQYRIYRND